MGAPSRPASAGIYCRISRDNAGEGLGVARQEELCRKLAAEKGWTVAEVYIDNDLSGFSGKHRASYERMLADLEAGTIDGVLVVDQDRLTRHPMELEGFITMADRLGIPLANVSGDIDFSTSDGRFRARIMGAVARQESEKKSERARRQRDQQAKLGRSHGGGRRYGYSFARDADGAATLDIVPEEAAVIREVATRFLAGESLFALAHDLNDRGVPTVRGRYWLVQSLRSMLTGPHLVGLRVHRGQVVGEANWPPILDRPTFEAVQAKIATSRRKRGRPPAYLLSGLLRCTHCGGKMNHNANSRGGIYHCSPSPGSPKCGKTGISASAAERIVTDQLLEALAIPELFAALEGGIEVDMDALADHIVDAEQRMADLARHYAEGRINEAEWFTARATLADRLDTLQAQIPTSAPVVIGLPTDADGLRELWQEATIDERRQIVGSVVESIVVHPGVPGRKVVDPNRIEIRWRTDTH